MSRRTSSDRAADLWNANEPLEAGRLIFESLPLSYRPRWAANVLRFVRDRLQLEPYPIARILELAERVCDWAQAHDAFRETRNETLRLEALAQRTALEELQLSILLLGEHVTQVLYNATDPDDAFDDDSGWWVASTARHLVDKLGDAGFERDMWTELTRAP